MSEQSSVFTVADALAYLRTDQSDLHDRLCADVIERQQREVEEAEADARTANIRVDQMAAEWIKLKDSQVTNRERGFTPATSKELISLRDICKHRGESENCLLCRSADEIERYHTRVLRLQQQVSNLRSALNMAGDLLISQRRPTLAQEAQIIAALSGDSGPVAAHEPAAAPTTHSEPLHE